MKGQASLEMLLILAAILSALSGFIYYAQGSNESINAYSAVQTGVENSVTKLELKHKISVNYDIDQDGDDFTISLKYWGGNLSNSSIENLVYNEAVSFVYKAFRDKYPDSIPESVSTDRHEFRIFVNASVVTKNE